MSCGAVLANVTCSPGVDAVDRRAAGVVDRARCRCTSDIDQPSSAESSKRRTRAGTPAQTERAGSSPRTTAFAPITAPSPIRAPRRTVALAPIHTFGPITIGLISKSPDDGGAPTAWSWSRIDTSSPRYVPAPIAIAECAASVLWCPTNAPGPRSIRPSPYTAMVVASSTSQPAPSLSCARGSRKSRQLRPTRAAFPTSMPGWMKRHARALSRLMTRRARRPMACGLIGRAHSPRLGANGASPALSAARGVRKQIVLRVASTRSRSTSIPRSPRRPWERRWLASASSSAATIPCHVTPVGDTVQAILVGTLRRSVEVTSRTRRAEKFAESQAVALEVYDAR